MHVDSRMHVVEHVPPAVVRVFIHYKVLTAVPAPIRADRPIPIRHLEIKTSGKPEAVMVAVKFLNVIAVRRSEMFKMSTLGRMVDVIPLCTGAGGTCPLLALGTSLRPSERGASASCPSECPPSGCCAYSPVVPNKIPAPNSSSDSALIISLLCF